MTTMSRVVYGSRWAATTAWVRTCTNTAARYGRGPADVVYWGYTAYIGPYRNRPFS